LSAFALPTVQTMTAVLQIITDREQFYRVRMRAAYCYAQLIAVLLSTLRIFARFHFC